MTSFWQKIRADFPITRRCAYLDHASAGPIPKPVAAAYEKYSRVHLQQADFSWPRWVQQREEIRIKTARFINAEPGEIAFTHSTSHGMNLIAELLHRKGKVLCNTLEFPSSTVPWLWRGAQMIFQQDENGAVPLPALKKNLNAGVKTIVSSFVQYGTGYRQDLEALGRLKKNRFLVVNATQGCGALAIDVKRWQADFLCTNSYKWLLGGYGGGFLYVNRRWLDALKPESAGWRSMREPDRMDNRRLDLRRDAGRYEWGCPAFPVIFAMGAAIDYLTQIGTDRIEKRVLELATFAAESLEENGFEVVTPRVDGKMRSGIVVFRLANAAPVVKKLLAAGFYVSARGAGIRVAPHFYNTFEEIDRFVKKVTSLVKAGSRR